MEDSPSTSRPASRAQSDATERPDSSHGAFFTSGGPRSLAREIDHIKALISHSQAAPRAPDLHGATISAQIFRRRTNSSAAQEHVPVARIFQELDSLKKRVKLELAQQQRVASPVPFQSALLTQPLGSGVLGLRTQIVSRDPDETETESESEELAEVPDEREEELERAREELALERQRREEWLGNAEERIDRLAEEKDKLEDELVDSSRARKAGEKSLREAEDKIHDLGRQIQKVQQSSHAAKQESEGLQDANNAVLVTEKADLQRRLDSTQMSMSDVSSQLNQMKVEHASGISLLERENQTVTDQLQRTIDEYKTRATASEEKLESVQKQHGDFQRKVQSLERGLIDAETAAAETRQQHENRHDELVGQIEGHKQLLEKALRDVEGRESEVKQVVNDRDGAKDRIAVLTKDLAEHRTKLDAMSAERDEQEKSLKATKRDHAAELATLLARNDERVKSLEDEHDLTRKRLEIAADEVKSAHETEIQALQSQHEARTQELLAGSDSATKELEASLEGVRRSHAEQSDSLRREHEQHTKSLADEHQSALQSLQDDLESTKKTHLGELGELRSAHDIQLKSATDETNSLLSQLRDNQSMHSQYIEESKAQIADLHRQNTESHGRTTELEAMITAKETEHDNLLAERRSEHAAEVSRLQDEATKAQQQHEAAIDAHATALELQKEQHDEVVASRSAEHTADLGRLRAEAEAATEIVSKSHADATANLQIAHQNALQQYRDEFRATTEEQSAEHAAEDERLRSEAEKRTEAAAKGHSDAIADLQTTHGKALDDQKTQHAAEIERIGQEAEQAISKMGSEHTATIAEIRVAHSKAVGDAAEQHRSEVGEMRSRTETLQAEHQLASDRASKVHQSALESLIAKYRSDFDNSDSDAKKQLGELRAQHASDLATLHEEHRTATEKLSADHNSILLEISSARQEEKNEVTAQAKEQLEEQSTSHAFELENLRKEHAEAQTSAQAAHDMAVTAVREDHASELAQARQAHEGALRAINADLATKQSEHSQEMDQLQTKCSDLLADLKIRHNFESERLVSEHGAEVQKTRKDLGDAHGAALITKDAEHCQDVERTKIDLEEAHSSALVAKHAEHERAIDQLQGKLSEQLANFEMKHNSQRERESSEHEAELTRVRNDHQSALQAADAEHQKAAADLKDQHRDTIAELGTEKHGAVSELERALQKQTAEHETEIQRLREDHVREVETAHSALGSSTLELQQSHEAALRAQHATHVERLEEKRCEHVQALDAVKAEHQQAVVNLSTKIADSEFRHIQALNDLEATKLIEFENLRADHESHNTTLQQRLDDEMNAAREVLEDKLQDMQVGVESHVNEIKATHAQVLADRDNEWVAEVAKIKEAHGRDLDDAMSHNDADSTERLNYHKKKHSEDLRNAIESAHLDAQTQSLTAEAQYQQALQHARNMGRSEVDALKASHEEALQSLLSETEDQTHAQLIDMEENHQVALNAAVAEANNGWEETLQRQTVLHSEEIAHLHETLTTELTVLQSELEKAAAYRQHEMNRIELHHQDSSAVLSARLTDAEKLSSEMVYETQSMGAEIVALRARLDAELTAHAEAERALAKMQRQRADEDKHGNDSKDFLQKQLTNLRQEKDEISSQHARVSTSLRDLRRKSQIGSSPQTPGMSDDLMEAQIRIVAIESERDEAVNSVQEALSEKTALVHQNDFLVKELETLMSQFSASKPAHGSRADAGVQTEVSSPSRSPSANGHESPLGRQEPKSDRAVKGRLQGVQRPLTPLRHVTAAADTKRHWRTGSFEDYLEQAKVELSELGSVNSANETLFAQKIEEHIGGLQRAKDQLADEYMQDLDVLVVEKDEMQKTAVTRGAADFARERKKLVATYGVELDEPGARTVILTGLPLQKAVALRMAEERLVVEYTRRIAKRKSQIALRHAEEYHNLTQDYDRKITVLLQDRDRLESDLSVEPSQFERDIDELDQSIQDETARQSSAQAISPPKVPAEPRSNMQIPRRVLTSTPRTPTSIPRVSSLTKPGAMHPVISPAIGIEIPSRVSSIRARTPSEKYVPIPQRSLLRVKSPPGGAIPLRAVTSPNSSEKRASPASTEHNSRAQDFGVAAKDFEAGPVQSIPAPVRAIAKRTAEPRASMEERRLLRMPDGHGADDAATLALAAGAAIRTSVPQHARHNSKLRHSSGSIYRRQTAAQ